MTSTVPSTVTGRDLPRELADLLDREQIRSCILRYCRGVDRFDADLMLDCYHPGAIDDHGVELPAPEFVANAMRRDPSRSRVHHVGNILVELHGDVAFAETYWVAYQAWSEGGDTLVRSRCGRYADRFERRAGRWKIAHRRVVDDWSSVQAVDGVIPDASVHRGTTYPHDPSYLMIAEIVRSLGAAPATDEGLR
jgi:ketosteroid isomerase-like protein